MITCVIASYQRSQVLIETIGMLKRQTMPPDHIVLVGERIEKRVAQQTDCLFVPCENHPLSVKWQTGIYKARDLESDAVLIMGSDSWPSHQWIEVCLPALEKFDYVGRISGYKCYISSGEQIEILQTQISKRRRERGRERHGFTPPLGAGRLISKRILDKMDWCLFKGESNKGMDGLSSRAMTSVGATSSLMMEAPIHIMGIKGPWPALTLYTLLKTSSLTESMDKIPFKKAATWLEEHFPGAVNALQRTVPGAIIC